MGRRKKPSTSGAASGAPAPPTSGAPAPPTRGAPAPPTTAPRWWATLTDEDPITLEPLGDLAIAPVEVNGRYFDAASLAAYLAESGRLEDPCTRAPLGRAACAALAALLLLPCAAAGVRCCKRRAECRRNNFEKVLGLPKSAVLVLFPNHRSSEMYTFFPNH